MRILYFHQHFSTPEGSTGTRSYEFAKRLIARGHSVVMICGSYGGGVTGLQGPYVKGRRFGVVDGIDVIEFELPYSNSDRFLKRSWIFLKFVIRSLSVAISADADLVIATSTPLTVGIPGIAAKVLRRRRFIFEVRDLWPELPREMGVIKNRFILWGMEALEFLSYRSADACIALAPGIAEGILRKAPGKRVAMIPNGSDLDLSEGSKPLPSVVRSCLAAHKGKLKCAFTGAHGIANGLHAVLDVAAELKRRGRGDIVLIFVGAGMMKPSLVQRSTVEGLSNCVFLDPIPKRALIQLQAHIDVGLMILDNVPAFYNGTSPNKFFDYLSAGLPILINYPGWLAQFVERECCGLAVPPGDASRFADVLQYFAENPSVRNAMGERARALAEATFSRDRLASDFVSFIEGTA